MINLFEIRSINLLLEFQKKYAYLNFNISFISSVILYDFH